MAVVKKSIKVRLYPTEKQKVLIDKTIGCARFVYNQTLEDCKRSYKQSKHFPSQNERIKNLVLLKETHTLNFIRYKCDWYGKEFKQVDRFYASSKICSYCGAYHKDIVDSLSVREWICLDCGAQHDRDVNAARNILNRALGVGY